jgi:hypothetical protein
MVAPETDDEFEAKIEAELARERETEARLVAARAEVETAQADAAEAHAEAAVLARDVGDLLGQLAQRVQRLEEVKGRLDRAAHVEGWHITHTGGGVGRGCVVQQLPLSRLAATAAFRIARVLTTLGGIDERG